MKTTHLELESSMRKGALMERKRGSAIDSALRAAKLHDDAEFRASLIGDGDKVPGVSLDAAHAAIAQRSGIAVVGRPIETPHSEETEKVQLLPLTRTAEIRAAEQSVSGVEGGYRANLTFATETPVERRDYTGPYMEILSLRSGHVRLGRLNNGAPLLNAHGAQSGFRPLEPTLSAMIGVVESARIEGGLGIASVRFSQREDVQGIVEDVRDGIIQNVSVGYRVYKYEKTDGGNGKIPTLRAIDWEPFEVSLVPMGADDLAGVRNAAPQQHNECEIEIIHGGNMPTPINPAALELERVAAIDNTLQVAGLNGDTQFRAALVNSNVTLDAARAAILDKMATRSEKNPIDPHQRVAVGLASEDTALAGIERALLHRINPAKFPLENTPGAAYVGRSLMELGRMTLEVRGVRTDGLNRSRVAGMALGLESRAPGMHSTSDFPLILANVANKTLRSAYEDAPGGLILVSRRKSLNDFKPVSRMQLGQGPSLKKVNEAGEFTYGTIGEERETYKLATFGRIFAITRQAIVNDDLSAFEQIPAAFGQASRALERDLLAEPIITNAAMADTVALFHADHFNLGTGELSIAGLSLGRAAMRAQRGTDGRLIDIEPAWIIVPAALETAAEQVVSALQAAKFSDVNPFAGRLKVAVETRLDANSTAAWYLFAEPGRADTLELGFLDGQDGPFIETRIGFEVDGMEIKCRHDCAAKAIDWRAMRKSDGVVLG
jgi:hypothetical protein